MEEALLLLLRDFSILQDDGGKDQDLEELDSTLERVMKKVLESLRANVPKTHCEQIIYWLDKQSEALNQQLTASQDTIAFFDHSAMRNCANKAKRHSESAVKQDPDCMTRVMSDLLSEFRPEISSQKKQQQQATLLSEKTNPLKAPKMHGLPSFLVESSVSSAMKNKRAGKFPRFSSHPNDETMMDLTETAGSPLNPTIWVIEEVSTQQEQGRRRSRPVYALREMDTARNFILDEFFLDPNTGEGYERASSLISIMDLTNSTKLRLVLADSLDVMTTKRSRSEQVVTMNGYSVRNTDVFYQEEEPSNTPLSLEWGREQQYPDDRDEETFQRMLDEEGFRTPEGQTSGLTYRGRDEDVKRSQRTLIEEQRRFLEQESPLPLPLPTPPYQNRDKISFIIRPCAPQDLVMEWMRRDKRIPSFYHYGILKEDVQGRLLKTNTAIFSLKSEQGISFIKKLALDNMGDLDSRSLYTISRLLEAVDSNSLVEDERDSPNQPEDISMEDDARKAELEESLYNLCSMANETFGVNLKQTPFEHTFLVELTTKASNLLYSSRKSEFTLNASNVDHEFVAYLLLLQVATTAESAHLFLMAAVDKARSMYPNNREIIDRILTNEKLSSMLAMGPNTSEMANGQGSRSFFSSIAKSGKAALDWVKSITNKWWAYKSLISVLLAIIILGWFASQVDVSQSTSHVPAFYTDIKSSLSDNLYRTGEDLKNFATAVGKEENKNVTLNLQSLLDYNKKIGEGRESSTLLGRWVIQTNGWLNGVSVNNGTLNMGDSSINLLSLDNGTRKIVESCVNGTVQPEAKATCDAISAGYTNIRESVFHFYTAPWVTSLIKEISSSSEKMISEIGSFFTQDLSGQQEVNGDKGLVENLNVLPQTSGILKWLKIGSIVEKSFRVLNYISVIQMWLVSPLSVGLTLTNWISWGISKYLEKKAKAYKVQFERLKLERERMGLSPPSRAFMDHLVNACWMLFWSLEFASSILSTTFALLNAASALLVIVPTMMITLLNITMVGHYFTGLFTLIASAGIQAISLGSGLAKLLQKLPWMVKSLLAVGGAFGLYKSFKWKTEEEGGVD